MRPLRITKNNGSHYPDARMVIKCDKEYKLITLYPSITEGAHENNITVQSVWDCLNGITKTCVGCYWFYIDKLPKQFLDVNKELPGALLKELTKNSKKKNTIAH